MTDLPNLTRNPAEQKALMGQLVSLFGNDGNDDVLIIFDQSGHEQNGHDESALLAGLVSSLVQTLTASGANPKIVSTAAVATNLNSLGLSPGSQRWALVCVLDPQIENKLLTSLLARLRDLYAARVVHIDRCIRWSFADSLALGFAEVPPEKFRDRENGGFRAFEFEIRNYKQTPDWLNAKNWANPELWGKHNW